MLEADQLLAQWIPATTQVPGMLKHSVKGAQHVGGVNISTNIRYQDVCLPTSPPGTSQRMDVTPRQYISTHFKLNLINVVTASNLSICY